MSRVTPFQPTSSNIATTPNFSAVPTSTGLAQGDMVFWNKGDYQPFSAQVTTASFPLAFDAPIMSGVTGGIGGTINYNMTSTAPSGGNSAARNVGTLSNGNIVVASASTSGVGYFTIYDTTFATVVSRVTLPGTQTAYNNTVGVAALTGGGFVIYFTNSSGYFCYAVYTNAGAVTTALSADTTYTMGTVNNPFAVVGLSGGGFVAVGGSGGLQAFYMIYNASGTRTFSGAVGSTMGSTAIPVVVANNNNTFFMMWLQNGNASYQWYQISSANATLGNGTFATTASVSSGPATCTATVLGNGTTIAIAYALNSAESFGVRLYNSSTYSMGSQTAYSAPYTGQAVLSLYAKTLSSGNVFLCIAQPWVTYYTMFNSSMTPIIASGTTTASPAFKSFSTKYNNQGSVPPYISSCMFGMEIGTSLYTFYSAQRAFGDGNQMYDSIDLTAYNPVLSLSASLSAGTATLNVGAYVPSSLTPVSVAYYPASTTGVAAGSASISGGSQNFVNGAYTPNNYDVCTLTNGNFVIVYRDDSSPYTVYAKVYGPTGGTGTTYTIGTATSTGQYNSVKVAALASGKFVVAYYDATNSVTCAIVSATGSVTGTVAIANVQSSPSIGTSYLGLGTLTNDRFVVAWNNSPTNYYYINSYDANGVLLSAITTATSDNVNDVAGLPGGGYVLLCNNNIYYYQELSANTFTLLGTQSVSYNNPISRMNITSKGQVVVYLPYNQWGGSVSMGVYRYSLVNRANGSMLADFVKTFTPGSQHPFPGCELQNGTFATVECYTTNITVNARGTAGSPSATVIANSVALIRPLQNDSFVMVFKSNSGGYLSYAIVYTGYILTSLVTAGVTPSSTITLTSGTYMFAGVSANTVAANGTGIVQTNGMAKLNSTYSTAVPAQAFNARNTAYPGVSGTINGRSMQLYGSSITGTT